MVYIDVHCHLDICKDVKKAVENAGENGVSIIITNGVNKETNRESLKIAEKFSGVKAALGLYPDDAEKMSDKDIEKEIKFITKNKDKICAIGEVGLDFKESKDFQKQERIFLKFIDLAIKLNKPVIVHSRKAEERCIELLEKCGAKKVIMHCFSGGMKLVERIIRNGWFLSIPANIKNSEHFQNVVKIIPLDFILCETDSPFLHPDKKGNNEPINVIESYKKIAEIKKISIDEVVKEVERNFRIVMTS